MRRSLGLLLIFERKCLLAAFGGFPPAGEVIPGVRSAPARDVAVFFPPWMELTKLTKAFWHFPFYGKKFTFSDR
jgi:hypothetical protein